MKPPVIIKTNQVNKANAIPCTPPPRPPNTNPETWRKFYHRVCYEWEKPVHLKPYNLEIWFRDACNTFAIAFGKGNMRTLNENEKSECAQFAWVELQRLTADNLNAEWQKIIEKLVGEYPESLCVGTAQALLSLLCKFAYALWVI